MKISVYIFSITFTILLLFNSIKVTLSYAYYNLNTSNFIALFCKNQDKPKLECNGKCYLKKIAKSLNKEQQTPDDLINYKELLVYTTTFETITFSKLKYTLQKQIMVYQNCYAFIIINDCFHPPQV